MIADAASDFGGLVLAAGAVGTAAMGLVEALKWTPLGLAGLSTVKSDLSKPALDALRVVYGATSFDNLLAGAWRKSAGELENTLRTGLRLAVFTTADISAFARAFGESEPEKLVDAIRLLRSANTDEQPDPSLAEARGRLARFEAVVDARVRAAVAAGGDRYIYTMQSTAGVLALGGCVAYAGVYGGDMATAIVVGLVAVPLAPVAKDIVAFLNSLRDVFQKKPSAA